MKTSLGGLDALKLCDGGYIYTELKVNFDS